jgi:secondary thiamine-phosphate synthase enzyme
VFRDLPIGRRVADIALVEPHHVHSESTPQSAELARDSIESAAALLIGPRVSLRSLNMHHTHYLWFETKKRQEIIDITDQVETEVKKSEVKEGFVLVSAMHISASVFVNDHESGLWQDILKWLEGTIAPWDPSRYRHNETGEDNAAAHLRSLTVGHEVIVPITAGKLDFGPWQRVFYGEWDGQRRKRVIIKVMGE